jgi:hypothetical protein
MKKIYAHLFITVFIFLSSVVVQPLQAQCPFGFIPGTTAYDTTIATPPGINTLFVKFPQADPLAGMVTCLRLCVSITGVVDSISVENNSASPQTADVYYIRTDQILGPGLSGPLVNSINHHYGPYALGPTNGVFGSGPDFMSISHDTLLNAVTVCQTINNLDSLFQFYGMDSVTYLYNITAFTNVTCTGGNYNSTVATSALVRFRFEYCTCPGYVLPLNIRDFTAEKIADNQAKLTWTGFDEHHNNETFHYEMEMSRDGSSFITVSQRSPNQSGPDKYDYTYTTGSNGSGKYYFRIRQVYESGYSRFSEIKQVQLKSSESPKFIIYPNPSDGIVGIKFDNNQDGKKLLQIFNSHGQKVVEKDIEVKGSSYRQVATLKSGNYWVRLTDVATGMSSVSQLFIK